MIVDATKSCCLLPGDRQRGHAGRPIEVAISINRRVRARCSRVWKRLAMRFVARRRRRGYQVNRARRWRPSLYFPGQNAAAERE